jgi:ribonuclease P protein component
MIDEEHHNETHLSTEQARPQAPSWFSRPHGHQGWPEGDCGAPQSGSQASVGLMVPLPHQGADPQSSNISMSPDEICTGQAQQRSPSFVLITLKQRREFQEAGRGPRYSTPSFSMVRRLPKTQEAALMGLRFGFTVTKKVGSSPERNRIRRRLREAVRAASPRFSGLALDLVILARREVLHHPFTVLTADIVRAVEVLSRRDQPPTSRRPSSHGKKPAEKNDKREDCAVSLPSSVISDLAKPPSSA